MMRRAAEIVYLLACWSLILAAQATQPAPAQASQPAGFADHDAIQLLNQIRDGLDSRSQKKILSAFDLEKMSGAAVFKQQIAGFLAQSDLIRIHFNQLQTTIENGRGIATAQVEMEADPRDTNLLPVYKQTQLHFVAENGPAGWKFTDIQPRSFFSRQP